MPPELPAQLTPGEKPTGAPGAFRTERATPAAFGSLQAEALGRTGAALEGVGGELATMAVNFQKQQNETEVDAANVKFDEQRRKVLFDEDGFYAKKGKTAYDAMAPTAGEIEKMRADTRASLKNPEQQRMFDTLSRRSTQIDLRSMSVHAAQENQVYRVSVAESAIGNAQAEARAKWNDPVSFANALGDVKIHAENRARLMGHTDPEQIKHDVAHYESQTWDARIRAAANVNPLLARQMFDANEDRIADPTIKGNLDHLLSVAVLPQEARRDSEKVMTTTPLPNLQEAGGAPAAAGGGVPTSEVTGGSDAAKQHEQNIASLQGEIARKGQTPKNLKVLQAELATEQAALQKVNAGGQPASTKQQTAPTSATDTRALLATWVPAAEAEAERTHPGNMVYRDMVVAQVKGKVSTIAQMQDGLERQATKTLKDFIVANKITTMDEINANPQANQAMASVPPGALQGIVALLEHNGRTARGEYVKSDAKLVNDLRERIWLPDGDPQKITTPNQLTPYFAKGLNYTDSERLSKELQHSQTPEGNPFLKQVNGIKGAARRMLVNSMEAMNIRYPDLAEESAYRFAHDLDDRIAAARKVGPDAVQALFTPGNKDYVLDPNRVGGFMPTQQQIAASKARGIKPVTTPQAGGGAAVPRNPGETADAYLKRIGK